MLLEAQRSIGWLVLKPNQVKFISIFVHAVAFHTVGPAVTLCGAAAGGGRQAHLREVNVDVQQPAVPRLIFRVGDCLPLPDKAPLLKRGAFVGQREQGIWLRRFVLQRGVSNVNHLP